MECIFKRAKIIIKKTYNKRKNKSEDFDFLSGYLIALIATKEYQFERYCVEAGMEYSRSRVD